MEEGLPRVLQESATWRMPGVDGGGGDDDRGDGLGFGSEEMLGEHSSMSAEEMEEMSAEEEEAYESGRGMPGMPGMPDGRPSEPVDPDDPHQMFGHLDPEAKAEVKRMRIEVEEQMRPARQRLQEEGWTGEEAQQDLDAMSEGASTLLELQQGRNDIFPPELIRTCLALSIKEIKRQRQDAALTIFVSLFDKTVPLDPESLFLRVLAVCVNHMVSEQVDAFEGGYLRELPASFVDVARGAGGLGYMDLEGGDDESFKSVFLRLKTREQTKLIDQAGSIQKRLDSPGFQSRDGDPSRPGPNNSDL